MTRLLRILAMGVAAAAVLMLPASAVAAPNSTTFAVSGFEYAFTPDVGFFAGSAIGNAGDRGIWNANVEHDRLGSPPPIHVTGGQFQMATRSPSGALDFVVGSFVDQGGTITTLDPGANCTNERFLVTGTLANVLTSTSSGGTGTFSVTLTHHRASLFGRCITFAATVAGTVSFVY